MPVNIAITELEKATWTDEWSTSINPVKASAYYHTQPSGIGLIISMIHLIEGEYGGWLCKNVTPLIAQTANMSFTLNMMIDSATLSNAQVIELDSKVTDSAGWTYDRSAQLELRKNAPYWTLQVGSPWSDTNVLIPPFPANTLVTLTFNGTIDYVGHTSKITSIDVAYDGIANHYPVSNPVVTPAKQLGWGHSQIVSQLQQCSNGHKGGYTLTFAGVSYLLS